MSEQWNPPVTHTADELAGAAQYLARAIATGATNQASAVDALADWVQDVPEELAPAAYAIAYDHRALDLLTRAAFVVTV
jgi:hypothetical protein